MTVRWFVGASLLLLCECANPVWVRDGATAQDYNADHYSCERDVRQSGYYGEGLVGTLNMQQFFSSCMVAHGYTLERSDEVASENLPSLGLGNDLKSEWKQTCMTNCSRSGDISQNQCEASCSR